MQPALIPISLLILAYLSLLPCLSLQLLQLPSRLLISLAQLPRPQLLATPPGGPLSLTVRCLSHRHSGTQTDIWKGLVSTQAVHYPHEQAGQCTLKSRVSFPHLVPDKDSQHHSVNPWYLGHGRTPKDSKLPTSHF